ncbi:MAG: hypothetical protein QNK04_05300 [Myxococcota bacterium]|nr:hypothetical protein [Myxococcota bacterium]
MSAAQHELLADDRCDAACARWEADVSYRVCTTCGAYGFVIDWPHENQPRPILRCEVCSAWVCEDRAEISPGPDRCPRLHGHLRA